MKPYYFKIRPLLCATVFLMRVLPLISAAQDSPEKILLKDYRPKSIYKIPITEVPKARFAAIGMHSHAYAKTPEQIDAWIKVMDEVGIEKSIRVTLSGL